MTRAPGLELGRRVKEYRLQKGLTLKDIEARVGVSATHVSEVERGKTSPTVGALSKIAEALGVSASHLIDFPSGLTVSVTHPGQRLALEVPNTPVRAEVLTREQPYAQITMLLVTIDQNQAREFIREARPGDKFVSILEGIIEFKVGEKSYLLKRGDSLHFKASSPQSLRNVGETPCRILWADWPRYTL